MDDAAAGAADGDGSGNASAGAADEDEPPIEGTDNTQVRALVDLTFDFAPHAASGAIGGGAPAGAADGGAAASDEQYLALRQDEPGSTHLERVAFPLRTKYLASGDINRRRARFTIAEMKSNYVVENTSAPTVAPDVIRFLTRFALRVGATFGTLDLGGAYFFDEAPDVDTTGNEFCGSVHEPGVSPPP